MTNLTKLTDNLDHRFSEENFKAILDSAANSSLISSSKTLSDINTNEITKALKPFESQLKQFSTFYQTSVATEAADRNKLRGEITNISRNAIALSEDAQNLTKAMRGDNKTIGCWGEAKLENILNLSGLKKNVDYLREEDLGEGEDGKGRRADVIVKIPNDGHLIIDSKMSLKAYLDYTESKTREEELENIEKLIDSTKKHIKGLSKKHYHHSSKVKSPDFVFMFLPIEKIYNLLLENDKNLNDFAANMQIILVAPSSLLAALKTVSMVWRETHLTKNSEEIARQAGLMYDKFCNFVSDLEDVKDHLKKADSAIEGAKNKLASGRDNLVGKAKKIKDLGAKTKKSLVIDL